MILKNTNISKFSFAEAMSNSSGKTSGSKFAGFIALISGSLGFIIAVIASLFKYTDAIGLAGIAAGVISSSLVLFGYSKNQGAKDNTINSEN